MNSVSVLVVVCISLVAVQGEVAPVINYNCSGVDDITIDTDSFSAYHTYAVVPNLANPEDKQLVLNGTKDDITHCEVPLSDTSVGIIKLNNCAQPVILYLIQESLSNKIVGGNDFHEYFLSCDFPKEGIDAAVVAGVSAIPYQPVETKEPIFDIHLHMEITPAKVVIGEQLTVTITETGNEHFLLPKSCEATDGTDAGERQTLIESGKTKDLNLLANFVVSTKGSTTANMFAFKFLTTDYVQINCTVTACKDKTCVNEAYTIAPATGRRRRSAQEAGPETYKVSAAFKIIDKKNINQVSGQSIVRVDPMVVLSLLLVTIATTLRKI